MGTKKDGDDCYKQALDDEPMFILLGRDYSAPIVIREWARQRLTEIAIGNKPSSDHEKVDEALETARRMEDWRRFNYGKWRDNMTPK